MRKEYPTLKERPIAQVKAYRLTKQEVKEANREFKDGMAEEFRESELKLARSAHKAREIIIKSDLMEVIS